MRTREGGNPQAALNLGTISAALLMCGVTYLITWLMLRIRILALPNDRSSHDIPIPSGGGVAIVVTFFIGLGAIYLVDASGMIQFHYVHPNYRIRLDPELLLTIARMGHGGGRAP